VSARVPTTVEEETVTERVQALLAQMTIEEKIGQLQLVQGGGWHVPDHLRDAVRAGRVGSVLNEVHVESVNELQRLAVHESRLGIPLLIGRDVIHGFKTVFPIPLGQAATWDPAVVERGARIAALEAASHGVNWTFAPMLDIGRDPRWGRVAEGYGEDPYLTGVMGAAAVRGFQGPQLDAPGSIAACAKHYAGYGASESGKDYNSTNIAENELRNVHLPPFKAALDAGCATVMTSFSDLDGVPATANQFLLRQVLRQEWGFDGAVVSDWESVRQLAVHGLTEDDRGSARAAALAGVDIEMASTTYVEHLAALIHDGEVPLTVLDAMVANVLTLKLRLGLFERPWTDPSAFPAPGAAAHVAAAREAAVQSVVLLKNAHGMLPLSAERPPRLAVIGPLADEAHEQLGTWIFDGDAGLSVSVVAALRAQQPALHVEHVRGLPTTRSHDHSGFADAVAAAERSEVVLMVLGEEAILSGEAHCRADITLPGAQQALLEAVAATGRPVVLVVLAGRALALEAVVPHVHALLYAWHPGCMGGPALVDLLFGRVVPSGKLPVTLPRVTGQIPIYYAHKRTGKPATPETIVHMDDIPARATQLSIGNTSFHLDVHPSPLFAFGFGLSYTTFRYEHLTLSHEVLQRHETLTVSVDLTNTGAHDATETVQLYLNDPVASTTRPVRELVGFQRVALAAGEHRRVHFTLTADDLAFSGASRQRAAEPGRFHLWVGGSSEPGLHRAFSLAH
jgi:beta-glucosidase